jgi:hypothetical protein
VHRALRVANHTELVQRLGTKQSHTALVTCIQYSVWAGNSHAKTSLRPLWDASKTM